MLCLSLSVKISDPFDVRGVTSGNISRGNDDRSSTSEMPPPLPGFSGDGTSAAAILTDGDQAVEETPASMGASTGLDGLAHTPPVLTPPVPSGEVTSGQSVPPQDNAIARILVDVTDRLGALEDVLRTQRQAYPLQS